MKEATAPTAARQRRLADLGLLVMALIWAVNFSIAKIVLREVEPMAFNALRFPVAALAAYAALRMGGPIRLPRRADWPRILLLAFLGNVLYQLLFIYGLDRTTAGNASLLLAGSPIMTAVLSAAVGHEAVRTRIWIGLLTTVAGIALIVGEGGDLAAGRPTLGGDLLLVTASLSWAIYTVSARSLVDRYGSVSVTAWTLWIGTAMLVIAGAPALLDSDLATISTGAWLGLLYAGGLSIGLAYLLWYNGVRHVGNTRTALYSNVVPVIALLVAWLWLHESPTPRQLVGAAVIIGGVSLARIEPGARRWRV